VDQHNNNPNGNNPYSSHPVYQPHPDVAAPSTSGASPYDYYEQYNADPQLTVHSQNQLTITSLKSLGDKPLDLDSCISRLVQVGQTNTMTRQVCLKQAEIVSICHRAQDIFLSQPVRKGKLYVVK
jgi:serine/threonine-protein phosphatase PP1 catalytic subunit